MGEWTWEQEGLGEGGMRERVLGKTTRIRDSSGIS